MIRTWHRHMMITGQVQAPRAASNREMSIGEQLGCTGDVEAREGHAGPRDHQQVLGKRRAFGNLQAVLAILAAGLRGCVNREIAGTTPPRETTMLKLVDVKQGGPPSPTSPHARHHTKNAEELRLQKDLSELELPPNIMLHFPLGKDKLQVFDITLVPDEGYFQGGAFLFAFTIPESYPHDPPRVTCLTKVFHPSIDTEGHVDLSTICEDWMPSNNIKTVIFGLNRLFLLPHTEDPLNHAAAEMLERDPEQFKAAVQQSVHAGATIAGQWFPPARGDKTINAK